MENTERQIDDCLAPGAKWGPLLRFPQPLEASFQQHSVAALRAITTRMGMTGILLFNVFLIGDVILYPDRLWRCIFIRVCLFTPVAAIGIYIGERYPGTLRHENSRVFALAFAGICALAAGSSATPQASVFTELNLILILSIGNFAMRLRMPYLFALNLLWLTENCVYLTRFAHLDTRFRLGCFFIYCAFGIGTIVAAYQMEREQRFIFLLMQRDDLRTSQLATSNRDLVQLSAIDPLTGVANRRHLELYLQDLWAAPMHHPEPILSIIMADIDHFKRINDTYGHLAGDRVLKLVATALRAGVRSPTDLVARFGGEEFVVVLPNLPQESVLRIAERISIEIRNTILVEHGHATPIAMTISCGIATARVSPETTPRQLLDQADRALYHAKNSGRDRVCTFHQPFDTHPWELHQPAVSA